jgi:hypothetical protein
VGRGRDRFGFWAVIFGLGGSALGGCEGKHRDFAPATSRLLPGADSADAASAAPGSGPEGLGRAGDESVGVNILALGKACTDQGSCASGHCVDGVCCDSACTDLCATCAPPGKEGTCSPASSDVACDALACPSDTECRARDQTAVALNCEGIGACRTDILCEAIDRPQGASCQGGAGTCNGAGACVVPGKALLGASCSDDQECAEGHCVGAEGAAICCDAPCDGQCEQCSAAGHCDQKPATDPRCEAVTCPGDNPCRDYPDTLTQNLCARFSQCATAQSCPATALRPAANCDCDAELHCTLREGITCTTTADCTTGACQPSLSGDTICCAETCGAGLSCAADGSGCVECEGPAVTCDGSASVTCVDGRRVPVDCTSGCTDGLGCNTEAPVGFSCATVQCVTGAVCQDDVNGARRCCTRDCAAEAKECASDGSCVCPPGQMDALGSGCELQQGDPCGSGSAQCGAGLTCVDGLCCNEGCGGACESCNQPGSVGICAFNSRDTAGCENGEQCVGRNDCRGGLGRSCGAPTDCVSNNCEPLIGVSAASTCCAADCTGQTPSCTSDGNRCVQCQSNSDCPNGCNATQGVCNPTRNLGETCSVAGQCASNVCLPDANDSNLNRCCPRCGVGQLCSSAGTCQDPPLGAGGRCANDNDCASGLFCRDGVCCTSQCDGACQTCGGNGVCNAPQVSDPLNCSAVTCAQQSNACRTVTPPSLGQCNGLGQCAGSAQCNVQLRAAGTACNGNGQCDAGGNCIVDTIPPNVSGGALGTSSVTFDGTQLSWNAATDDRTAQPALVYTVLHSFADNLTGTAQQIRARAGVTVLTATTGSTSANVIFPRLGTQRQSSQFLNVLVSDAARNESVYAGVQLTLSDPARCSQNRDCLGEVCSTVFFDQDGDRFGDSLTTVGACGNSLPTGFVARGGDCCDIDALAFPRAAPSTIGLPNRNACDSFDYNCDGVATSIGAQVRVFQDCTGLSIANCTDGTGWISAMPACGDTGDIGICNVPTGGTCTNVSGVGNVARSCL